MDERMASSAQREREVTAEKIQLWQDRKTKEPTKRRTARRIEEKGYVGHIRFSRIFVLRAASFRREDARLNRS